MRFSDARSILVGLALALAVALPACTDDPLISGLNGGSTDLVLGGGGPAQTSYCEPVGTPDSVTQQEMYQVLNQYRVANGREQLLYSDTLEEAAAFQARDLYQRHFFDHTNPDGDGPWERAVAAGFCQPAWIGENIAYGQRSVEEVQLGWQHSPGHNENMLRTEFTYVGMGHYTSPLGVQYWVQVFGTTGQ